MYGAEAENVFYYLTVYNEPFPQPPAPEIEGLDEGVLRGLYRYQQAPRVLAGTERPRVQLLASGSAMHWALRAQELLAEDWGVAADVWSATSWNELRRDAVSCDEDRCCTPARRPRIPCVTQQLDGAPGPVVAVSDWMRARAGPDRPLGAAGLHLARHRRLRPVRHPGGAAPALPGRRAVDRLCGAGQLARRGEIKPERVEEAARRYELLDETAVDTAGSVETDQPASAG